MTLLILTYLELAFLVSQMSPAPTSIADDWFRWNIDSSNISNITVLCEYSIGVGQLSMIFIPVLLLGIIHSAIVKQYNTNDGVVFQWIVSGFLWTCGVIVHIIQGFPNFYALAMIGGCLWTTGNMLILPMTRLLGFYPSILIWNLVFMVTGWSTAFIGVSNYQLCATFFNYGGIVLCICGIIVLAFMHPIRINYINKKKYVNFPNEGYLNLSNEKVLMHLSKKQFNYYTFKNSNSVTQISKLEYRSDNYLFWLFRLSPLKKKILGFLLSVCAGLALGLHFLIIDYLLTKSKDNAYFSYNSLDYMLPYATGALIPSTLYVIIYMLISSWNGALPIIQSRAILPASICGILTGVSFSFWLYLNSKMGPAITFPIIATGTPACTIILKVLTYSGWKNYVILLSAMLFILSGILLILLSRTRLLMDYV